MEIKVGDKVRLKAGLEDGEEYGSLTYRNEFYTHDFKCEYMTVTQIDKVDDTFRVEGGSYWFSFEMVGVCKHSHSSESTPEFKVGDKVKLKAGLENGKWYGKVFMEDCIRFNGDGVIEEVNPTEIRVRNFEQDDFWFYDKGMLELVESAPDDKPKPEKPKTKYKVGDKVRIRADLETGGKYYDMECNSHTMCATSDMVDLKGTVVTIKKVCIDNHGYKIEGSGWNWTDGMFEGLAESEPVTERVFIDDLETVKPIVIYPNCDDSFTSDWMKEFMKRYGG